MEYLIGAACVLLVVINGALLWIYRPSALPAAMERQAKAEIARDEAIKKGTQSEAERDQARREAVAATQRAEIAERALHDQLKTQLPHLPGDVVLSELQRLLQEAGAAGTAPTGADPGHADPGGVPVTAPHVVNPWPDDP